MLYGGETWSQNDSDLQRLQHNDGAMLRWICGVKDNDGTSSEDLLAKLLLFDGTVVLRTHRLRWFRHVKRSDDLSSVMDLAWGVRVKRSAHAFVRFGFCPSFISL